MLPQGYTEHCQDTVGVDPAFLLSTADAASGVLCLILGSSLQERHGYEHYIALGPFFHKSHP